MNKCNYFLTLLFRIINIFYHLKKTLNTVLCKIDIKIALFNFLYFINYTEYNMACCFVLSNWKYTYKLYLFNLNLLKYFSVIKIYLNVLTVIKIEKRILLKSCKNSDSKNTFFVLRGNTYQRYNVGILTDVGLKLL